MSSVANKYLILPNLLRNSNKFKFSSLRNKSPEVSRGLFDKRLNKNYDEGSKCKRTFRLFYLKYQVYVHYLLFERALYGTTQREIDLDFKYAKNCSKHTNHADTKTFCLCK